MRAYVGADWCGKRLACATATGADSARKIRGAGPVLAEVRDLVERVRARHAEATEVHVLIEAGSPIWAHLLHEVGAVVYVTDPKQAKRYAQSLSSSGAKSDGADASMLADMLRSSAHCPKRWAPTGELEPLQSATATYTQARREATRVKQQIRDRLRQHMPLLDQQIGDLGSQWPRRLLREIPTPAQIPSLCREAFDTLMAGGRTTTRERVWEALQQSHAPWMSQGVADVETLRLRLLLDRLDLLLVQLDQLEEQIDRLTQAFTARKPLESVRGIGLQLASSLLVFAFGECEVDQLHRDRAGLLLGACPVFVGSGRRRDGRNKGTVHMRRSVSPRAQQTAYLLGRLATRFLPWAAAMFQDGRRRGQSAGTAYRRVARSLLRILTAMVRTQQPYDDRRYVQALQARGVPWAMELPLPEP